VQRFLRWCDKTDRRLCDLLASDVDAYFIDEVKGAVPRFGASHSRRTEIIPAAVRGSGRMRSPLTRDDPWPADLCAGIAPIRPGWSDVRRILAFVDPSKAREVRDRAIRCSLQSTAYAAVRLPVCGSIRLIGRPDLADISVKAATGANLSVGGVRRGGAGALHRYGQAANASQQVFMTVQARCGPIAPRAIYHVVHRRFALSGSRQPHQGLTRCDTPARRTWSPMA